MKKIFLLFILLPFFSVLSAQDISKQQYKEDFEYFWTTINNYYSYFDKKQTDWDKVKLIYSPLVDTITSKSNFVLLLETIFHELYDHHASLSTNTAESHRLVPSGTDIWAEYVNNRPTIVEVRNGFGAENSGLKPGMQIVAFNDMVIEDAIRILLPKALKKPDIEAKNYALRVLLAGKHSELKKITITSQNRQQDYYPDQPVNLLKEHTYKGAIESRIIRKNIGYIRINNRLGDNSIIPVFDSVLTSLANTRGLILDLRETPGGGNTTVARSILGRFISKEGFYQKHELIAELREFGVKRSWTEIVSPKKPVYAKPLVVIANHWTGSVGEGIVIGFDALKRGTIIGTPMAGLNGANYSFTMPHTGIGFSFPAEKLFQVNGRPREIFKPHILVDMTGPASSKDKILEEAVRFLNKKNK